MNYSQLKKLDEETLEKLTEGPGPSDKCLCSLLYSPDDEGKKGIKASIKKAFASLGGGKQKQKHTVYGQNSIDIPLTYTKGGKGIYTTKEVIKRASPCGKCGCDSETFSLKHSYANIRITAPDVDLSSLCPCPSNCMPDYKEKLQSSIKVTVEHLAVSDADDASQATEYTVSEDSRRTTSDPELLRRSGGSSAVEVREGEDSAGPGRGG